MKRTLIAAAAATLLMTASANAGGYGRHYGHHHHHHGHGWGGFALGAIVGGVIAHNYRPRYYAPPTYYTAAVLLRARHHTGHSQTTCHRPCMPSPVHRAARRNPAVVMATNGPMQWVRFTAS